MDAMALEFMFLCVRVRVCAGYHAAGPQTCQFFEACECAGSERRNAVGADVSVGTHTELGTISNIHYAAPDTSLQRGQRMRRIRET